MFEKNYKEKMVTYRKNDTTFYNSNQFIYNNCHNIFSLLELAQTSPKKVIDREFIIDRDGQLFKAKFTLKSQSGNILILDLAINIIKGQKYGERKNDIFLWGLFMPEFQRLIWVDRHRNKIIKCRFMNSLIRLDADLIQ